MLLFVLFEYSLVITIAAKYCLSNDNAREGNINPKRRRNTRHMGRRSFGGVCRDLALLSIVMHYGGPEICKVILSRILLQISSWVQISLICKIMFTFRHYVITK